MTDETTRLPETESWIRSTTLGRRGVMLGGAAVAGYALAAQPVAASAIHTGADGLDAGWVTVNSGGFAMRAYRAKPAGKKHAPVILIVHEVFGLHEWVQDMVRRYAKAGYHAIAPDLFQRKGDASQVADIKELVTNIVSQTPDAQVMADLDATTAFAGKEGGDIKRLGITGYCWGGRIVWLYAAHSPRLLAGVACYGQLAPSQRNPQGVIQMASKIKAPVLGLYGELDKGIPQSDVAAMRSALEHSRSASKIKVFAGADHGFFADYRPSYNEAAAREGWADSLAWFKQWLV
jgi:carboxymethylenebutenolidase